MKLGESNGHSSGAGYRIEARTKDGQPIQLGRQLFAGEWRLVDFPESPAGVKASRNSDFINHGLMDYGAAKAIQHWFISDVGISSIEARVVAYNLKTNWEVTRLDEEAPISWDKVKFVKQDDAQ